MLLGCVLIALGLAANGLVAAAVDGPITNALVTIDMVGCWWVAVVVIDAFGCASNGPLDKMLYGLQK